MEKNKHSYLRFSETVDNGMKSKGDLKPKETNTTKKESLNKDSLKQTTMIDKNIYTFTITGSFLLTMYPPPHW